MRNHRAIVSTQVRGWEKNLIPVNKGLFLQYSAQFTVGAHATCDNQCFCLGLSQRIPAFESKNIDHSRLKACRDIGSTNF